MFYRSIYFFRGEVDYFNDRFQEINIFLHDYLVYCTARTNLTEIVDFVNENSKLRKILK